MPRSKGPAGKARSTSFPTKEQVLAFINESAEPVGKREIARAFRIKGSDRIRLKALLKDLEREGLLAKQPQRRLAPPGHLPNVLVVEVSGLDEDGEMLARPTVWEEDRPPPTIYLAPERSSRSALAVGERVLARLKKTGDGSYEAQVIRKLDRPQRRVLGIYELGSEGGRLRPTDKRAKSDFIVTTENAAGAEPGELVLAEVLPERRRSQRLGLRSARVLQRLGRGDDPKALSLITLHEHGLISEFPAEAVSEAEAAGPVGLGKREDLRDLLLVTIDGADARDFDDAVFAEPDDDPKNAGGWHLLVAIADVAHYVRPGSALDRSAHARGNSVYFPDRVLPMLPTALSNGWCSLNPKEDRPCMAAHLWIDRDGLLLRQRFVRGLMRSAARLTYEEVQAARDGRPVEAGDGRNETVLEAVLPALYGAYQALLNGREKRGTLELDLPERKIRLSDDGQVVGIDARERLDSHRLIEEFMITANVAAAKELERLGRPCMYRVHDKPDPVRLKALAEVLEGLGLRLNASQVVRPRLLTQLLTKAAGKPEAGLVNDLVLRCQSQAIYSPENIGHFGLALTHYAHFTSPIRRYADLMVHRALISGLKLGKDGLPADAEGQFDETASHISTTERSASAAERDAVDRFTAAYLKDRVGDEFSGRVNGVTRFGLFVTLDDNGADGLIPISTLPDDFYHHVESRHSLEGQRWGRVYRLGDRVSVRLLEAEPVTGGLILSLIETNNGETKSSKGDGNTRSSSRPGASGDRDRNTVRKMPQTQRKTRKSTKTNKDKGKPKRSKSTGNSRRGAGVGPKTPRGRKVR
ncbi:ribonuclease R [Pelagibius litoralis]|uniref:Ribonuclease R n=1 Tax=Pelagibius litoralis TaxID=374515 RepID=A0A967K862_9PROT|nr:ribonuclease R [Pelagibius litoralis]NIA70258.1 ribonuclease R [Pelagibius litoralis]